MASHVTVIEFSLHECKLPELRAMMREADLHCLSQDELEEGGDVMSFRVVIDPCAPAPIMTYHRVVDPLGDRQWVEVNERHRSYRTFHGFCIDRDNVVAMAFHHLARHHFITEDRANGARLILCSRVL